MVNGELMLSLLLPEGRIRMHSIVNIYKDIGFRLLILVFRLCAQYLKQTKQTHKHTFEYILISAS